MRNVCIFYTDGNRLREITARYPACETVRLRGGPDRALFAERETQSIVFVARNEELQGLAAACRGLSFASVAVYPTDVGYAPREPIGIDISKPRLDYMETELCHVCNLNCKGCCDYSNLHVDTGFYDFDNFVKDLNRMKELFWGIAKIRLMGGEPLMNPRIADYAEKCREIFPDSDLRIVSNGLLLPKIPTDTLERIRDCGCSFDISNYPPSRKNKKEIVAAAERSGVPIKFGVPMNRFLRTILERPTDDPAPAFRNCLFTHCHMMGNGKLAPCSYAYCAYRFNARFGTDYPEDDLLELSDPSLDGWKIVKAFSEPHKYCVCCGRGALPYRWRGHVGPDQAKKEDWLIPDTALSRTVAPVIQKALKPAAVRLRALIQKKK
ncbi:MAG: radical SAM protein [Clostridia bacterium]|nr:radical SAM protein [Clostridia bacterium]